MVHILIIAAAALVFELVIAVLAGNFLHRGSERADAAGSEAMSLSREGSAPTASAVQGIPEDRQS